MHRNPLHELAGIVRANLDPADARRVLSRIDLPRRGDVSVPRERLQRELARVIDLVAVFEPDAVSDVRDEFGEAFGPLLQAV